MAARLDAADLQDAVLDGATLQRVHAVSASFRGATLVDADLREADLDGADFTGADLREADLRGARAIGAMFDEADLRGADLTGAAVPGALAALLADATCPDGTAAGPMGDCAAHMGLLSPQLAHRLGASTFVLDPPEDGDLTWTMRLDGEYLVLREGDPPYLARDERHYFRSAPRPSTVELVIDGDVLTAVELDADSGFPRRLAVVRPAP